jgi:hypothetical protein
VFDLYAAANGSINVVAPVPEPETDVLTMARLAVVGAAARRRNSE